jgi:hypothetical protein
MRQDFLTKRYLTFIFSDPTRSYGTNSAANSHPLIDGLVRYETLQRELIRYSL